MSQAQQAQPVSILVPAHNEARSVGKLVQAIHEVFSQRDDYEILVIDDGSEDGTAETAQASGAEVIRHDARLGYGQALKTGLRRATHEHVLIIDADLTYSAHDIPTLLSHARSFDMVVGARVGPDVTDALQRRMGKWIMRKLANYLSGRKIPDLNSGLRCFRRSLAEKFFPILPAGFSFTTTITLAFLSTGYTVKFCPVQYQGRGRHSRFRPLADSVQMAMLIARTILLFNPLRVLLPLSGILLAGAVAVLLVSHFVIGRIMDASVAILVLLGAQVAVLGCVADLVNKRGIR